MTWTWFDNCLCELSVLDSENYPRARGWCECAVRSLRRPRSGYRACSRAGADRVRYSPWLASRLKSLKADSRARVRDALETHLRHEPTKVSKSRIKRLRGLSRPQFRLRMDDIRVFYDVTDQAVEILTIVSKAEAEAWLAKEGSPESGSSSGEGQG